MPDHPTRDDIDFVEGHFYSDSPAKKYAWLHANAPVYFDAKNNVWGIASYAALLAAEKDPRTFSNAGGIRPGMGPIPMMIDMDDPEHWKRRKLVNKGFTPKRVRESEPKIRAVCDEIIDSVCERGECDFVNDIAAWLPMILIGDLLGVAPEARGELLQWSDDMLKMQSGSVAFGFGAHYCLGQALARLELVVMFEQLMRRLPDIELAADPKTLPRRPANFVSGLESMPVRFTPSAPVKAGV